MWYPHVAITIRTIIGFLLGLLARVRDGVLQHVHALAVHVGVGALEGALLSVAVQLLQQRAAASEGQVVLISVLIRLLSLLLLLLSLA